MAKDKDKTVPTVASSPIKGSTGTRQVQLQVIDGRIEADTADTGVKQ